MAYEADKHLETNAPTITIKRRLYTQLEYDDVYKDKTVPRTAKEYLRSFFSCSKKTLISGVLSVFPIINTIRQYRLRQFIIGDLLGGFSTAFLHLPQGLAFGLLASLAPVYGIYSSFFPVILYVIFGTCHHISFGTNALIALLTSTVVNREAENFLRSASNATTVSEIDLLSHKVGVAMTVTFVSGLILLAMGVFRLGFITVYLSVSFIGGFTTASAIHIAVSQVSKMLGIKIKVHSGPGKLVLTCVDIFVNIAKTNPADIIIALIAFAILLGIKMGINERYSHKLKFPIPVDLILVIIGTVISHFAGLNKRYGVAVIGDVPRGMAVPTIPSLDIIPRVWSDCIVIAIIIFAMAIAMAKLMSRLHDYELDDNQELIAYGMCNFASSFFSCFPSTTAPPRTMILSSLGAKTTLNGFPSALFILIVLLVAGQLFVSLPIALLASMIVVAIKDLLFNMRHLPEIWCTSKADFVIWILTFLVCVFVDLDYGIISGVAVSFLIVIVHTQLASGSVRNLSDKEDIFIQGSGNQKIKELSGIKVFHFDSLLFFANAEKFKRELFQRVFNPSVKRNTDITREPPCTDDNKNEPNDACKPLTVENGLSEGENIHHIIIDCSSMTFIDIAGVNVLKLVISKYQKADAHIYLACCSNYMWKTLNRAHFFDTFSREHVFFEVWDAVNAAQQKRSSLVETRA